jgi:hypothetical protein
MSTTGPVIHVVAEGRYLIARQLPDGRYVAPVHEAFRGVWGHVKVGTLEEVMPAAYVYASVANARARARVLYPRG